MVDTASLTVLQRAYLPTRSDNNPGNFYNLQSGDGSVGNLDRISDATAIINLRQGSNIVGTGASASASASDASYDAHNISYGQSTKVANSLGSNSNVAVGGIIGAGTGSLYNFLGAGATGADTPTLHATSSFGQTTDAIMRMVGSAYFNAGTYDFQVRADDGFSVRIDGQVVLEYDANQSPTTRGTTVPIAIGEGLHTVEILYWEQGGNAELLVQYKPSGTVTFQTLSLDNLAMFQSENAPVLTELQDIIENPSQNGQYLIRTGQEAYGSAGADTITGSDGRDIIHGGAGADSLNGGGAADRVEGGAGNDTMIYGANDKFDGGSGVDRVLVNNSGVVNLTYDSAHFSGVEIIDLGDTSNRSNNQHTVTINASDVLDAGSSSLTIGTHSVDLLVLGDTNGTGSNNDNVDLNGFTALSGAANTNLSYTDPFTNTAHTYNIYVSATDPNIKVAVEVGLDVI